jgi:hypothetical protein
LQGRGSGDSRSPGSPPCGSSICAAGRRVAGLAFPEGPAAERQFLVRLQRHFSGQRLLSLRKQQ